MCSYQSREPCPWIVAGRAFGEIIAGEFWYITVLIVQRRQSGDAAYGARWI